VSAGSSRPVTDAEIITLAVMQALLSFTSEARFLRHANKHQRQMFPVLPGQSGYNKRLRKLTHTMAWLIGVLTTQVSVMTDQVWLVDSTPVECGRSRETVKRSDLRGYAEYGYCASHTRYFLGFRLHLIATVHGIPIAWARPAERSGPRTARVGSGWSARRVSAANGSTASIRPGRGTSTCCATPGL